MTSAPLRMEAVPDCLLCGTAGGTLYDGLRDRLYDVPGTFRFSRCPQCGFVWLNPRPVEEDIPKCYANYYTHQAPLAPDDSGRFLRGIRDNARRLILEAWYDYPSENSQSFIRFSAGMVLGAIPPLRVRAAYGLGVLFPPWHGRRRLLDIGCGNGAYLLQMRALGWEVAGIDIDEQAIAACRARGLPVFLGTLEECRFPDESFDVVTMNHVIEHVPDPLRLLRECRRVLSPGGYLALVTPNLESLGHTVFRENWLGLDPPRHLCLWEMATLRNCIQREDFRILKCYTRSAMAAYIYDCSWEIRRNGQVTLGRRRPSLQARVFAWAEKVLLLFRKNVGEEICLLARKE